MFDDLTDTDWEHALGGVHALVWEGAELVGHASVIQRRLLHDGRTLRAEEDGGIYVLPLAVPLNLFGELVCDWRDGDVW